jgi:mannosyl-oligosaccharide alpha-1,2-mannosidase
MVQHAYSGYAKYGWGANEHRPISKTGHSANVFGSNTLGITIIDSLDTIYLADLKTFYQKSREWIETQFNPNVVRLISLTLLSSSKIYSF